MRLGSLVRPGTIEGQTLGLSPVEAQLLVLLGELPFQLDVMAGQVDGVVGHLEVLVGLRLPHLSVTIIVFHRIINIFLRLFIEY